MYERLSSGLLKSGETLEIGVVVAPDEAFAPLVKPLLGHKPNPYRWHIDCAFEPGRIEELETRFYLGLLNGVPVCNIMTVEYRGVGILGHVYTVPEFRRRGACQMVMSEQMADFTRREGGCLTLGTGFDSPPYWIYHRFGFRSVAPGSGFMKYEPDASREKALFQGAAVETAVPAWKDWPMINALCARTDMSFLRSVAYGHYGPCNFEGGFLSMLRGVTEDPERHARMLRTTEGAVVGYATLQPDTRWRGDTLILDMFTHPAHTAHAHALLKALPLPRDRKIQCHTEEDAIWKIAALLEEGFEHEATIRSQLCHDDRWIDVEVYERRA
jgi:hypothetical protein